MTFLKTISLAGALALTTTAASASSWDLSGTIGLVPGGGSAGYEQIILQTEAGLTPLNVNANGVAATAFNVTATSLDDPNFSESFLAWCLDFTTSFFGNDRVWEKSGALNTATLPSALDSGVAVGALSRVQSLFNSVFQDTSQSIETQLGTGANGRRDSAAFQLAIWDLVFDDDWSVTDDQGRFWASDDTRNGDVINQAQAWLDGAELYSGPNRWQLTVYSSENRQDVITASTIPLPAAGWLLLGGLGALGALARRKRAAA